MKAVLISVRPKWCELIASGKKRIEVRKTRPKIETPFKCYIYKSFGKRKDCFAREIQTYFNCSKVIGSFVCDRIRQIDITVGIGDKEYPVLCGGDITASCFSYEEFEKYGKGKTIYGWHISDLKIYDKPKELGEFKKAGFMTEEQWLYALYPNTHCHYEAWAKRFEITHPPQSWCYVEEI